MRLYGGVGVGLLNYFIFIIIAVFISGLMVGRTPEFMGHKVEAREVKIAAIVTLLSAFLDKRVYCTWLLTWLCIIRILHWAVKPSAWLNNPCYHGFSEMLYEFTSANANNGSGFEGLGDNNIFWNVTTGIVMILGRFLPIIGPVLLRVLANKKFIPESAGTLRTDSVTFGIMTIAVIVIVTALSLFPATGIGTNSRIFFIY